MGHSGTTSVGLVCATLVGYHFGGCAVEELGLLWAGCAVKGATLGPLWWMCCGRASVGYSGHT